MYTTEYRCLIKKRDHIRPQNHLVSVKMQWVGGTTALNAIFHCSEENASSVVMSCLYHMREIDKVMGWFDGLVK